MMDHWQGWMPQAGSPPLAAGEVHVWRFSLTQDDAQLARLETTLSAAEVARADRFMFPLLRVNYIAAHGCLRDILGRYLRLSPGEIQYCLNEYGKPGLSIDHHPADLQFNLTHSKDLGLLAVGWGGQIGIDIEHLRPEVSYDALVERFFSPLEVQEYFSLPVEQRRWAFFTCWVRKEAVIKALGQGLSMPLDQFDVTLLPGEPARLRSTRPDPAQALQWKLYDVFPQLGYTAALAVASGASRIQRWQWLP